MSHFLLGRFGHFVIVSTLVVTGFTLGDLDSSQAQGPLRRIGDRIRARVDTLVQPPPPAVPAPAPTNVPPQASAGLRRVAPYATPETRNNGLAQPTIPTGTPNLAQPPIPSNGEISSAPSIGIEVDEFDNGFRGVRVVSFQPNSQASAAGLRIGDVIVGVEGLTTATIADVAQSLSALNAGQSAQLRIVRAESLADANMGGAQRQIPTQFLSVPLVDRQASASQIAMRREFEPNQQATYNQQTSDATLGVVLNNVTGRQGAVIASVAARSPGEVARMQAGDRIVSINGRMVQNTDSVFQALNRAQPGDQLRVQWVRDDQLREANIVLAGKDGISPNALANQDPSKADSVDSAPQPPAGSLLNGIGSTLGNWFGNGNKPGEKPGNKPAVQTETSALIEQPALGEPADELPRPKSGTSDALTDLAGPSVLMDDTDTSVESLGIGLDVTRELPEPGSVVGSEELPMPKAVRDPLEFGDEELVQPATFGETEMKNRANVLPIPSVVEPGDSLQAPESLSAPDTSINKSLKPALTPFDGATDPPSLGGVTPPSKQPPGFVSKEDQTILLLRSEIERLRNRIQQLEK